MSKKQSPLSLPGEAVIRPARLADRDSYRELRLSALRDHPQAFGSDYAHNLAQPPEFWEKRLQDSQGKIGILYLAEVDANLAGMTGIRRGDSPKDEHSGMIWGVYVRPAWRGKHLADALIEHCLDWAREKGLTIVRLGVSAGNGPAINCYLRCGFSVYGVEARSLRVAGEYYDELLMHRFL